MRATKSLYLVLLAAAIAFVPAAFAAPVVHVLGAGSSALWQPTAIAAVNDLAPLAAACQSPFTCSIHHWELKNGGDCGSVSGGGCTELFDSRISGGVQPGLQGGNIWIAWVTCTSATCPTGYTTGQDTDVWADVSVDSTVGVRTFLARGASGGVATSLQLTSNADINNSLQTSDNAINDNLFKYGVAAASSGSGCAAEGSPPAPGTTCDDKYVPHDVYLVLTGGATSTLTTGFTDIRPEDAKEATKRINKPFDTGGYFLGLGYSTAGSALVGSVIKSGVSGSTASAEPDNFSLPGNTDPFNGQAVPTTITVLPIGESPITFLVNRSNSANLGALNAAGTQYFYNDLWDTLQQPGGTYITKLGKLFFGKDISGAAAAFWNTGVIGPAPPAGGFAAIPAGQTYTSEVAFIATNGLGGAGTFDIKIDPTLVSPPWGVSPTCSGTPPANLADGAGVILSGTSAGGSSVNFDGVYLVSQYSGDGNGSCNKITVTAYGIPQTLTDPAYTRYPPGCSVNPTTGCLSPEATVTWWTPTNFNLHLLIREPLSGTYNTAEFTSIREFGGPTGASGGSNDSSQTSLPSKSQEADYTDSTGATPQQMPNPVSAHLGWFPPSLDTPAQPTPSPGNGDRTRVIGTSEMVSGASGVGGIQHTADSLGYAFFSFGNVSALAAQTAYGYLQLDGIDPIFASYTGSEPGQASSNGQLPKCTAGTNCATSKLWAVGTCGDGVLGCSYPNIRNGTYRAWSLLRAICDTANAHCLSSSDALGTEALIANAQMDIHCSGNPSGAPAFCASHTIAGVPDFLPFDDTKSWTATGYGDAGYYRSNYTPGLIWDNDGPYNYSAEISFYTPSADPGGPVFGQDPANAPVEAGGDVGGCIIAVGDTADLNCQQ